MCLAWNRPNSLFFRLTPTHFARMLFCSFLGISDVHDPSVAYCRNTLTFIGCKHRPRLSHVAAAWSHAISVQCVIAYILTVGTNGRRTRDEVKRMVGCIRYSCPVVYRDGSSNTEIFVLFFDLVLVQDNCRSASTSKPLGIRTMVSDASVVPNIFTRIIWLIALLRATYLARKRIPQCASPAAGSIDIGLY